MPTWTQVKGTLAASDEVNAALRQISDLHSGLIDRHDVEGLLSLARVLGTLAAANEPQGPRVTATEPEGSLPFTVVAGKFYSDGERSYSYIESFGTLAEAEAALDKVRSYPFAEIESSENGSH